MMNRVGFIMPDNEFIQMKYNEVEAFCRDICFREENLEEFKRFSKSYSYFNPYFDYVMVNKKFLFFNPLYLNRKFMIFDRNAYYLNDLVSFRYDENVEAYKERCSRESFISSFTLSSDRELNISKQDLNSSMDCMIDSNLYGMMSMSGTYSLDGSHVVTGATVLNNLLIKSRKINNSFNNYIKQVGVVDIENAVDFLVENLGFLRVARSHYSNLIIGNEEICSNNLLNYVDECKNIGYEYFSAFGFDNLVDEYQEKVLKK